MDSNSLYLLTVEQFAKRMQVSRTTVFGWLKSGVLQEGVHYLRIGRILRLGWREGLFFNSQQRQLSEDDSQEAPLSPVRSELDSQRGAASVPGPGLTFSRGAAPAINLDY